MGAQLGHIYPELEVEVGKVFAGCRQTLDQETQQRAVEYTALSDPALAELKGSVLEMMPPFPERESAVLKRIKVAATARCRHLRLPHASPLASLPLTRALTPPFPSPRPPPHPPPAR